MRQQSPDEPVLDAEQIQGNVLPGFNSRYQHLIGLNIPAGDDGTERARAWLAGLHPTTLAQMADTVRRKIVKARNRLEHIS